MVSLEMLISLQEEWTDLAERFKDTCVAEVHACFCHAAART